MCRKATTDVKTSLVVCMQIPLSSTLAFGGIGGLAFGLASKDVISNFFGGI